MSRLYNFLCLKRWILANILKAYINIVNSYQTNIQTLTNGNNRANNMGDGLEEFIKNIFAGTIFESDEQKRLKIFENIYSYSGNKNNLLNLLYEIII